MGDFKSLYITILVTVLFSLAIVQIFSQGAVNGGYSLGNYALNNSTVFTYLNQTQSFTGQFTNSTQQAPTKAATYDPTSVFASNAIITSITGTMSLLFNGLGIMLSLAGATFSSIAWIGLPFYFATFGYMFIGGLFVIAIAGVVLRWFV